MSAVFATEPFVLRNTSGRTDRVPGLDLLPIYLEIQAAACETTITQILVNLLYENAAACKVDGI